DLPELIDQMPGVFNQRTNRAAGAPILRGFVGPSNLLLVDGVRLNTAIFRTGPNQYAAMMDPLGLESVELVLGPGSVLYGSNAMGGVLHSITRSVPREDGWTGTALSRFASADTATQGAVHLAGRKGNIMGWVGGSVRRHDDLRVGGGELLDRTGYLHLDWRGRVAVQLGDRWTLTNTYLGNDVGDGTRTDKITKGDLRFYGNTQHLVYSELRRRGKRTLRDLRLTASFLRLEDRVERYSCETGPGSAACLQLEDGVVTRKRNYDDAVNAMGLSTVGVLGWFQDKLRLTTGFDGRMEQISSALIDAKSEDDFEPVEKDRGNFSTDSTYTTADVFTVLEGLVWSSPGLMDVRATGGLRA
ncbi:MAG: TonB-dependent receptor, partial [Myxococcota bacterium]|nr:TonB-dependent receptor [Myxococcota bacterium]